MLQNRCLPGSLALRYAMGSPQDINSGVLFLVCRQLSNRVAVAPAALHAAMGGAAAPGPQTVTSTGLAPTAALGPTPMLTQVPQACASVSSYSVGATGRRLQQSSTNNQRITLSSQVVVRAWVCSLTHA